MGGVLCNIWREVIVKLTIVFECKIRKMSYVGSHIPYVLIQYLLTYNPVIR